MKKKFNPSAALGYKRIKPLYDKAVSDLVEANRTIDAQKEQFWEQFCDNNLLIAKTDRQKAKLKDAGHMIGRLIREREVAKSEISNLSILLTSHQDELVEVQQALLKERKHRGVSMHSQMALHNEVQALRDVSVIHRAARGKAEREKLAALADVQKLKKAKRNWAILAGAAVGLLIAAGYKLVEMGAI